MRRRLVLGFGLAGLIGGSALGQFAVDRTPPASSPPVSSPGGTAAPQAPPASPYQPAPVSGGAYTPPVGGLTPTSAYGNPGGGTMPAAFNANGTGGNLPAFPSSPPPANLEISSALGPDHPWAVKPEHGAYFICVKSYSRPNRPTPDDPGPSARVMAEKLAAEVRDTFRVQAFLYEHVSEERKAEMAAIASAREKGRIFAQQLEKYKQESQLKGMEFLEPDNRLRFKTINYREQIAVLVGGFQTAEDARKALDTVHLWPPPHDRTLMDMAVGERIGPNGKPTVERGYLNPFASATVVPNPTIQREVKQEPVGLEPFIVRLNEGRPYNLLKATKSWTLAVRSFNAPIQIVGKDSKPSPVEQSDTKIRAALIASAQQAEALAKTLRELKDKDGKSLGLEAFVLHTRYSSLVTVGQFDTPNDPSLMHIQNILMKMKMTEDSMGTRAAMNAAPLFEGRMLPIPIPKP